MPTPNEGDEVKCLYCGEVHKLAKLEAALGVFVCPTCKVSTQYTDKGWTRAVWTDGRTLEELCNRCGHCCYEKLRCNGRVYIFMRNACPYLGKDLEGKAECSCYESRLKNQSGCISLYEAIKSCILPITCGYRVMFPSDYVPPKRVNSLKDLHI